MINTAKQFVGIGVDGKLSLMQYYNKNCYPYVDAKRKYKIQPNDDWCAMFTTVIAHMAGVSADKFPYEVSVYYQAEWAKRKGLWFTDITQAKPNDLIVYDWKKGNRYNHVGFIVSINRLSIKAIEGNKSKTVGYRTVSTGSSSIKGFIRLNYKAIPTTPKPTGSPVITASDRTAILAMRTVLGQYGNGEERIKALGNDMADVQRLVNLLNTKL